MNNNDTCCKGFAEQIILRHYGELDDAESARLESHIAACPSCRAYRDELARTLSAVSAYVPGPYETRRAHAGVMARLAAPAPAVRPWVRRLAPALVLAGFFAVAVGLTVYNPFAPVQKPPVDQVLMAKADWDSIEHIDVINDLDVVEAMDNIGDMDEL